MNLLAPTLLIISLASPTPAQQTSATFTVAAVPDPTADFQDLQVAIDSVPEGKLPRYLMHERPFEFRPVQLPQFIDPEPREPRASIWFKSVGELPDDDDLHRAMLAYVSDYYLIGTATRPHGTSIFDGKLQLASLDHALWFQRPFRVDEWLPDDPYPVARVEMWPDDDGALVDADDLDRVIGRFRRCMALASEAGVDVGVIPDELGPGGAATMQMAALLPVGPFDKQKLLGATGATERLAMLEAAIEDTQDLVTVRLTEG